MEELAQSLVESDHDLNDLEAIMERWDGHPEYIAEDIFQVRSNVTYQMEDLRLFYPYQPMLLHAYFFGDGRIINVYKGRRIGVSFIFCVAIAIDALKTPDSNYAVVSKTKAQSDERIADIRSLLVNSRVMDEDDLVTDNKSELVLPNGATIRSFTGEPDGARGMDSAKTVFVDEMAFLDDQDATMRAFMPFISLGDAQMLQVSTPKLSNDKFLKTHRRGDEYGKNGVISIQQATFKNPDTIDPTVNLFDQDVTPVRPDLNIQTVETERAQDPQGFAQEYLCQPVSDEYRFLSQSKVEDAQRRGAAIPDRFNEGVGGGKATGERAYWHPATHARLGGTMVMGVDIGIDRDNTAIAVFEHVGNRRYLRFHTIVERSDLRAVNVYPENTKNPESVANYIYRVSENMDIDKVYVDMTGPGRGFQESIQHRLGNRAEGFNFSDKEELKRMWGDLNFGLHKDLVTLVPDEQIHDQLSAIVKEQSYEDQKPRFSGKDYAEDGKDDLAMAIVLGAYPPKFKADRATTPQQRSDVSTGGDGRSVETEGEWREEPEEEGEQRPVYVPSTKPASRVTRDGPPAPPTGVRMRNTRTHRANTRYSSSRGSRVSNRRH